MHDQIAHVLMNAQRKALTLKNAQQNVPDLMNAQPNAHGLLLLYSHIVPKGFLP